MPRTQLMEKRSYDAEDLDHPITCPAGERISETAEGPGCLCRIEGSFISAARDGSSLGIFCQGSNALCPTWRLARETEWEHAKVLDLAAPSGVGRSFTIEDVQELESRRAAGDTAGVEAMQRRILEQRQSQLEQG